MNKQPGWISTEFTAWCGVCGGNAQISAANKNAAKREFRAMGWKDTRLYGWVCPDDAQKRK